MMLHTKSPRRSLLKLLALLPIVAITLAVNAETVTDYVYNEPQTPVKKGNKAGTINLGAGKTIVVEKADDAKAEATQSADLEKFTISGTVYDDCLRWFCFAEDAYYRSYRKDSGLKEGYGYRYGWQFPS